MSTTGRLFLRLKDRYQGKLMFKIPYIKDEDKDIVIDTTDAKYITSYINHDGHIQHLGKKIIKELNDNYFKILMYVLQGDRTTFDTPYYTFNDETYEGNRPKLCNELPEKVTLDDYYYIYDEHEPGVWSWKYCKYNKSTKNDLASLEEVFKEINENKRKYEELTVIR